jgi:hypothetical protein
LSSLTRNIALGSSSATVPENSITPSLAMLPFPSNEIEP